MHGVQAAANRSFRSTDEHDDGTVIPSDRGSEKINAQSAFYGSQDFKIQ
jgi:hypothetical protein